MPPPNTHTHQSGLYDPLLTSRLGERGEEGDTSKVHQTFFRPTAPDCILKRYLQRYPQVMSTEDEKSILFFFGGGGYILAKKSEIHSVVLDSLQDHGLQHTRLLYPWNFPGNNTGVGCHSLLPEIFPNPGTESRSPASQADSLP